MGFCVAIDGPAASGKGTIARAVAGHFGFGHLDTGLLYRAVGQRVLEGMPALAAARAMQAEDLDHPDLRGPDAARAASEVAALPDVRRALVDFQRAFAARAGGAVLDGRDIGTVICPDAPVKLFVTASPEARAARRQAELSANAHAASYDAVLADLQARDARDAGRVDAPLKLADDALLMDTTDMDIDEAVAEAIAAVAARLGPA